MKLYYSPGSCSLAPHIVLREAGCAFTIEQVDATGRIARTGAALSTVNGKGYVPILELHCGQSLTETAAILQYIADEKPEAALIPACGSLSRHRTLEWLVYIATELHKSFYPLLYRDAVARDWQETAQRRLTARYDWLNAELTGRSYLTGMRFSVADAYLFTVLRWTHDADIDLALWPVLSAYCARVEARPRVRETLEAEGLRIRSAA